MLRLLKKVQLSRYFSTATIPEPERNPAILYTGVSNIKLFIQNVQTKQIKKNNTETKYRNEFIKIYFLSYKQFNLNINI